MSATPSGILNNPRVTTTQLKDDGVIPNNPHLPLVVYHGAFNATQPGAADLIERQLKANSWAGTWRNGVYDYHHYHSTAHEVLVVVRGSARVQLGGEKGIIQELSPGDAVIIPAGVAHKNLGSSPDFMIIGAYPAGQDWDMNTGKPGERPKADENIRRVSLPQGDPLFGPAGPLLDYWKK